MSTILYFLIVIHSWSAPLKFKYEENIFDAIKTVLLEADKNGRIMHYREIHEGVTNLLNTALSHRKFGQHLGYMVNEKLLYREDPTGKRGSKVYYSLTEKAKRKSRLKILGIDEKVEKRKSLYRLLLFFEAYKRRDLLTERQLNIFLKRIGSSTKNLEKLHEDRLPDGTGIVAFKPIRDIEILGLIQNNSDQGTDDIIYYYTVLPGFTADEFIQYLEKLKKGKDPRPFSSFHAIFQIPFVQYMDFTKQEFEDAIVSLTEDGLIKPVLEVYPGEKRYDISDESLKRLILLIWRIKNIDFYLVYGALIYNDKLTEEEKNYLALFIGERKADKLSAYAYDMRRTIRNQDNNNWNEERENMKRFTQELKNYRQSLVEEITREYETIIKRDEIVRDLVQSICILPSFLSHT
jgi:hypothetical protein